MKKIKDHLEENLDKNGIYNICLGSIKTVNSFVDDNGNNHFEKMIKNIIEYINDDIIGINEPAAIMVNGKAITRKGCVYRNVFRREMRRKLNSSLNELSNLSKLIGEQL